MSKAYNLWQVKRIISDGVEYKVLQFVDHVKEVFSEGGHFQLI